MEYATGYATGMPLVCHWYAIGKEPAKGAWNSAAARGSMRFLGPAPVLVVLTAASLLASHAASPAWPSLAQPRPRRARFSQPASPSLA